MKPKMYSEITTICFFAALGSAVLFGHLEGLSRWMVALVAASAAIVSVRLYLKTQSQDNERKTEEEPFDASDSMELDAEVEKALVRHLELVAGARRQARRHIDVLFLMESSREAINPWALGGELVSKGGLRLWTQGTKFAKDVASIIKILSTEVEGIDYEFVMTREGHFLVKTVTRSKPTEKWLESGYVFKEAAKVH